MPSGSSTMRAAPPTIGSTSTTSGLMNPLAITSYTATTALGRGLAAQAAALRAERGGLHDRGFESCTLQTWIGEVTGLDQPLPADRADWECRNNRLADLGLQQDGFSAAVAAARERHGAGRIGVFMGTSTAGVQQTELAYGMLEDGRLLVQRQGLRFGQPGHRHRTVRRRGGGRHRQPVPDHAVRF